MKLQSRELYTATLVVAISCGLAFLGWQSEQGDAPDSEHAQSRNKLDTPGDDHLEEPDETGRSSDRTASVVAAEMVEDGGSPTPPDVPADEPEHRVFLRFQEAYHRAQRGDPRGFFDTHLSVSRCTFVERYDSEYCYRAYWENTPAAQTIDVNAKVEIYKACERVAEFLPEGTTMRDWHIDLVKAALEAGDRVAQLAGADGYGPAAEILDANPDLLLESAFAVAQAIAALASTSPDFVDRETEIGPWLLLKCRADPFCSVVELERKFADVLVAYEYQIVKDGYDALINRLTTGESLGLKNLMTDMRKRSPD